MMLLLYWSILVIIFPQLIITKATMWSVMLHFDRKYKFVHISLDKVKYVNMTSEKEQQIFKTEFELDNATKPSFVESDTGRIYWATVQNLDLQEKYHGSCPHTYCNKTMITLQKMARWTVEATRSDIHNNNDSFYISENGMNLNIKFKRNSRTSNASFFLPMEFNKMPEISIFMRRRFLFDKKVKLKNMENSKIYSCVVVEYPMLRCLLTNDSTWKIELTYRPMQIYRESIMSVSIGVIGSEKNTSQTVKFRKLAYVRKLFSFINIPYKSISEVEIKSMSIYQPIHISKIVLTKILTDEEYGCININRSNAGETNCKVRKGKNWLLKVISPEEQERNFSVEIIQDTSSFTEDLMWKYFSSYGYMYIQYFSLKSYGNGEITDINLHFHNKSLRINEISLISNYTEYKFKRNEESSTHNSSVAGFSRITKGIWCI
ncbi:Hypothetical predicted protein [Octopus vulgaris]|uniref:Uncharacterized protein n=1 Tax=Octopus vulgaris TaxID=6645 RepID=A0AA36FKY8_OCTVU|nr:Hypothetical predicted protein [Octopus vulgaris]